MQRLAGLVCLPLCLLSACMTSEDTSFGASLEQLEREVKVVTVEDQPTPVVEPETEREPTDSVLSADRFDVAVENTDLRVFIMGVVADTPYNVVVHPDINGNVYLELRQVTVVDVLEILQEIFDLHLEIRGNLVHVMPNTMETRIFTLNYVNLVRQGVSDMRVSTGSIKDAGTSSRQTSSESLGSASSNRSGEVVGSRVTTENKSDLWSDLKVAIESLTGSGDGRNVVILEQAGIIIVRALRRELAIVEDFLEQSENSLRRQVILEAKILEVVLKKRYERGIDWTALSDIGGEKGGPISFNLRASSVQNPLGVEGVFTSTASLVDFNSIIELLESQGAVRVLSSPRIATVNNQKAVIKVGTDEFFVTNVTSTTTTGTSTTTTPSVTLTPFFSGIALDVTPQISREGEVILHIHPTVSEVTDQNKIVTIGNDTVTLPLALSTIRESDSIVKARNGEIIVIGGLLRNSSRDLSAGVPFIGKIPLIGRGFSQKREESERSELVILVRPTVSEPTDQKRDVLDSLRRLESLGSR